MEEEASISHKREGLTYSTLVKRVCREIEGGQKHYKGTETTDPSNDGSKIATDVLLMRFKMGAETTSYLNNGVAMLASNSDPSITSFANTRAHESVTAAVYKHLHQKAQSEYDESPQRIDQIRQIVIWLFSVPEIAVGVISTVTLAYLKPSQEGGLRGLLKSLQPYLMECITAFRENKRMPNKSTTAKLEMKRAIEVTSKYEFGCILRTMERMLDQDIKGPAMHVNEVLRNVKSDAQELIESEVFKKWISPNTNADTDPIATWTTWAGHLGQPGPCEPSSTFFYRFPDKHAPTHITQKVPVTKHTHSVVDECTSQYDMFSREDDTRATFAVNIHFNVSTSTTLYSSPTRVRWKHAGILGEKQTTSSYTNTQTYAVLLEHIISKYQTLIREKMSNSNSTTHSDDSEDESDTNVSNQLPDDPQVHQVYQLADYMFLWSIIGAAKLQQLESLQLIRDGIHTGIEGAYPAENVTGEALYTTPVVLYKKKLTCYGGPTYKPKEISGFDGQAPTWEDVEIDVNVDTTMDRDVKPAYVNSHMASRQTIEPDLLSQANLLAHVRYGVRLCHLSNPSEDDPEKYMPAPLPMPGDPPTENSDATMKDRSLLWNEILREVSIGTDRLWVFVKLLSGAMGEPADSLLTLADENAQRARRTYDAHRKEISKRVGDFHAKLIESVVGGILRSSKLEAIPDQRDHDATDALFVADAEMAKEIRSLAAGESGRPFFEANIAIQEILRAKNGKQVSMSNLVASLTPVVTQLDNRMQADLMHSDMGGMGLESLSNPRNSFMVNLRNDVVSSLRIALDRLHREMYTDRVTLWELIEGASPSLSLRFAEFVAHVLIATRASSGTSALYVSVQMKANNVLQTRVALKRLVDECRLYTSLTDKPNFYSPDARNKYFTAWHQTK